MQFHTAKFSIPLKSSSIIMLKMVYYRSVEPEHAGIAGMFGSAAMGSGILAGIGFSALMPSLVSSPAMDWELPSFWPAYDPTN